MLLFTILLNRWFVLALGILLMLVGLKPDWTIAIVRMVGKMGWAEQGIGRGGTFGIWKFIGIIAPIAAMIYFFSGGIKLNQNHDTQVQSNDDYSYYSE